MFPDEWIKNRKKLKGTTGHNFLKFSVFRVWREFHSYSLKDIEIANLKISVRLFVNGFKIIEVSNLWIAIEFWQCWEGHYLRWMSKCMANNRTFCNSLALSFSRSPVRVSLSITQLSVFSCQTIIVPLRLSTFASFSFFLCLSAQVSLFWCVLRQ